MLSTPTNLRHEAEAAPSGPGKLRRQSVGHLLKRAAILLAIIVLLIIEVGPLVWLLVSSFKADTEFTSKPLWALPAGLDWQNYSDALITGNIGTYFLNS